MEKRKPPVDLDQPVLNPQVKQAISAFRENESAETYGNLLSALQVSFLSVATYIDNYNDLEQVEEDGQVYKHIPEGTKINIYTVSIGDKNFLPLFTDQEEIEKYTKTNNLMSQISTFINHVNFAVTHNYDGIIINPASDDFPISREGLQKLFLDKPAKLVKWLGIGCSDYLPINMPLSNSGVIKVLKKYNEEPTELNLDMAIAGICRSNFALRVDDTQSKIEAIRENNQTLAAPHSIFQLRLVSNDGGDTAALLIFADMDSFSKYPDEGKPVTMFIKDILLIAHSNEIDEVEINLGESSFFINRPMMERILNIIFSLTN